jgi:hypothetical protein
MREITQMNQTLAEIGPVQNELTVAAQAQVSTSSGKG